jgi:hypothetical protein
MRLCAILFCSAQCLPFHMKKKRVDHVAHTNELHDDVMWNSNEKKLCRVHFVSSSMMMVESSSSNCLAVTMRNLYRNSTRAKVQRVLEKEELTANSHLAH